MYIRVKAFPGSPRESVEQTSEHVYRIFIREEPKQNMANLRIKEILGNLYSKNPDAFQLITGNNGQNKVFKVLGM